MCRLPAVPVALLSITIADKTILVLPVVAVPVLMLSVTDSVRDYLLRSVSVYSFSFINSDREFRKYNSMVRKPAG